MKPQATNQERRAATTETRRREETEEMERVAIVAHLKDGCEDRAAELIANGPPFDLAETGIERHSVYLSASEVIFVFEGHQVEWMVDELIDGQFHYELQAALDQWRTIVDGSPRIARERFGWQRDTAEQAAIPAIEGSIK
jgi:hypothetical protein